MMDIDKQAVWVHELQVIADKDTSQSEPRFRIEFFELSQLSIFPE